MAQPHVRRPAAMAMRPEIASALFTGPARDRLLKLVDVDPALILQDLHSPAARATLSTAEVLITGWGCPAIDERALQGAPRLRAVVHTAGSVKHLVTEACWQRGIEVTSAAAANAVPVAEYTVAAIVFSNKRVLHVKDQYARLRDTDIDWHRELAGAGNYRRRVGIVGASRIGRRVITLLRDFDLEVLLSDPYLDPDEAGRLGVRLTDLPELFAACDTVSIHAPLLAQTVGMVTRDLLAAMPDGATLINTARGDLIDQQALEQELLSGRIWAVLDVTTPEALPASSPLYNLPNVLLTPHIAGSMGNELGRMADFALNELERWTKGLPFVDPVHLGIWDRSA